MPTKLEIINKLNSLKKDLDFSEECNNLAFMGTEEQLDFQILQLVDSYERTFTALIIYKEQLVEVNKRFEPVEMSFEDFILHTRTDDYDDLSESDFPTGFYYEPSIYRLIGLRRDKTIGNVIMELEPVDASIKKVYSVNLTDEYKYFLTIKS